MPGRNHIQRLRACAPFSIILTMSPSLERNPMCCTFPSNSRLLTLLTQHWHSQGVCSLYGHWLAYEFFLLLFLLWLPFGVALFIQFLLLFLLRRSFFPYQTSWWLQYFCLCVGATDTSTGCSSGSVARPITAAGAARAPVVLLSDPESSSTWGTVNYAE